MATKYVFTSSNGYAYKIGEQYIAIPDPSLYVNDTYIPFEPAGSYQDISVNATLMNNWEPSSGSASWITFSNIVNNGAVPGGWGSFRATAASNNVADRTGTITVISRYNTWEIDVSQNEAAAPATLSCSPTTVYLTTLGGACSGYTTTVTVTASAGNSWTASVTDGTSWVRINGTIDGTASGTGNGSFTIGAGRLLSGSRLGEVAVTSSAPTVNIMVSQGFCP